VDVVYCVITDNNGPIIVRYHTVDDVHLDLITVPVCPIVPASFRMTDCSKNARLRNKTMRSRPKLWGRGQNFGLEATLVSRT